VKANKALGFASVASLGYLGLTFNLANGEKAKGPTGANVKLRAALDAALGRATPVQVASGGIFTPGNQPLPPSSPFYASDPPVVKRDVAKARQLVRESGVVSPSFAVPTPNTGIAKQAMEAIRPCARRATIRRSARFWPTCRSSISGTAPGSTPATRASRASRPIATASCGSTA